MSAFDDFNLSAFEEAAGVFGTETFAISGSGSAFRGVLNEYAAEKEIDIGGLVGMYAATIVAAVAQFSAFTAPIERDLEGRKVTIEGRVFSISRAAIDETTVTLGLANPSKRS